MGWTGFLRRLTAVCAAAFVAALLFSCALAEQEAFTVVNKNKPASYRENRFEAVCPEDGTLTLTVRDETNVYQILTREVTRGVQSVFWNGLGLNDERLNRKYYEVYAVLTGVSGTEYTYSFNIYIEYSDQALIFALPSDDTVYLDEPGDWFLEFKNVLTGNLIAEFRPRGAGADEAPVLTVRRNSKLGVINTLTFTALRGKNDLPAGEYTVTCTMEGAPLYASSFDLTVAEGKREVLPLSVTGDIMPDRDATDAEIWACMTAPATVVDIKATDHQKVYASPDKASTVLGTLHGQSQALSVFELADGWARIGAWNHEEAVYIEGWVPAEKLKVVRPRTDYGLLIDKREQTVTVWKDGERYGTVAISTGLATPSAKQRETAAGSFLTDRHMVDFSMNGMKYDYVIRFDGGNLLHQIPYVWGGGKKDFTAPAALLGSKASHGCVRIQAEPGENGINAYWIWTHVPYRTRVIIWDD